MTNRLLRSISARIALFSLVTTLLACIVPGASLAANAVPKTDEEKTLYTLGTMIGTSLKPFSLTDAEFQFVRQGIADRVAGGDLALNPDDYASNVQALHVERAEGAAAKTEEASKEYLAERAAVKGAKVHESGLIMVETLAGSGAAPSATDTVTVHYHGTLPDGTVFDSSTDRGQPAQFPLNRVIPCWTEAVGMMKIGGKSTIVCPASIAYGSRGAGVIPPGSPIAFDVELISID